MTLWMGEEMTISLGQARDLLKRAVLTQGRDFVYNDTGCKKVTCLYKPNHRATGARSVTGCLVGVALDLSGETRHLESAGSVLRVYEDFPFMMERPAADYFFAAQQIQDDGGTWGEAYDAAEKTLL